MAGQAAAANPYMQQQALVGLGMGQGTVSPSLSFPLPPSLLVVFMREMDRILSWPRARLECRLCGLCILHTEYDIYTVYRQTPLRLMRETPRVQMADVSCVSTCMHTLYI